MQREIKFRAWSGREMLYDYIKLIEAPSGGYTVSERMFVAQDVMQYTGLHDKNGKEIYEGDLIFRIGKPYQVTFSDGAFCVDGEAMSGYDITNWEIIGNIYEDGHLLKD